MLAKQNPQCEGVKQDRFLFDSKPPTRRRTVYNVKTQGNELIIEAGIIHGVTLCATSELWESPEAYDNKLESPPCFLIQSATNPLPWRKNEDKYNAVEDPETVSREIGISHVKIRQTGLKHRINNYTFNWDRMKSFEGDTGPYLQSAHVRLASIGRKNQPHPPPSQIDTASLSSYSQAREIAFLLGTYPDVVKVALKTHEPSGAVTFLVLCF
ncbi:hypothetical protein K443DRAFT_9601 [Laccaria amethystina LaAM-08-1]|uniref:arginine--tRNA ligase n=1 Tax=Laccaria amethystina LaAM-08-1 TaxID=1095629 RepID=A0A0C9WYF3_9AGAR|nr:hypothetical protein K443DRAFT_9601 [Laccaria amethystina LaAM-08-1]